MAEPIWPSLYPAGVWQTDYKRFQNLAILPCIIADPATFNQRIQDQPQWKDFRNIYINYISATSNQSETLYIPEDVTVFDFCSFYSTLDPFTQFTSEQPTGLLFAGMVDHSETPLLILGIAMLGLAYFLYHRLRGAERNTFVFFLVAVTGIYLLMRWWQPATTTTWADATSRSVASLDDALNTSKTVSRTTHPLTQKNFSVGTFEDIDVFFIYQTHNMEYLNGTRWEALPTGLYNTKLRVRPTLLSRKPGSLMYTQI
jgi:hypothetical protein